MSIDLTKKIVISNYNSELDWLKITYQYGFGPENTVIYDRSDIEKDWSYLGKSIRSPNVGSNLYDILTFIIDNYHSLPDYTIFLKGNIFSPNEGHLSNKDKPEDYYTTKERFIKGLQEKSYFSFWYQVSWHHQNCPDYCKHLLEDGLMQQPLNHCDFSTNTDCQHKYFTHPHQLLDWCFVDSPKEEMIKFLPSSNMVLPKENILFYSKNLYEKLRSIIDYEPDHYFNCKIPAECYLLERIFYLMWSNKLVEK